MIWVIIALADKLVPIRCQALFEPAVAHCQQWSTETSGTTLGDIWIGKINFCHENDFENVVCKMSAILFITQRVNPYVTDFHTTHRGYPSIFERKCWQIYFWFATNMTKVRPCCYYLRHMEGNFALELSLVNITSKCICVCFQPQAIEYHIQ